jgi:hypothetical protein
MPPWSGSRCDVLRLVALQPTGHAKENLSRFSASPRMSKRPSVLKHQSSIVEWRWQMLTRRELAARLQATGLLKPGELPTAELGIR